MLLTLKEFQVSEINLEPEKIKIFCSNLATFIGYVNCQLGSCNFILMYSKERVLNDWEVQSLILI